MAATNPRRTVAAVAVTVMSLPLMVRVKRSPISTLAGVACHTLRVACASPRHTTIPGMVHLTRSKDGQSRSAAWPPRIHSST